MESRHAVVHRRIKDLWVLIDGAPAQTYQRLNHLPPWSVEIIWWLLPCRNPEDVRELCEGELAEHLSKTIPGVTGLQFSGKLPVDDFIFAMVDIASEAALLWAKPEYRLPIPNLPTFSRPEALVRHRWAEYPDVWAALRDALLPPLCRAIIVWDFHESESRDRLLGRVCRWAETCGAHFDPASPTEWERLLAGELIDRAWEIFKAALEMPPE